MNILLGSVFTSLILLSSTTSAWSAEEQDVDPRDQRIEELEERVRELEESRREGDGGKLSELEARIEEIEESRALDPHSWLQKFTLGGYGEVHFNFVEGTGGDQTDLHRFVLYIGYDFADWVRLNSETEIEHAFVSDDGDGELSIEQLHVDFLLCDAVNVRVGRVLAPLGIVNQKHEPPSFNGVERPGFAKYVIPTTWSSDGIGIFGDIIDSLTYELYVVASLDGSEFDAVKGIRDGRNKGRQSMNQPAVTGRVDFFPLLESAAGAGQTLRLGLSAFFGGLDNGEKGDDPGVDGHIEIYSVDFEYSVSCVDCRGAVAYELIENASELEGGVASAILGWYAEVAVHVMPASWKRGKLRRSDLVLFVRYDRFDTQFRTPPGVRRDPAGDREETTIGATFFVLPNLVVKADFQLRGDGTSQDVPETLNFGIGWQF
jgi:hypothetical protein